MIFLLVVYFSYKLVEHIRSKNKKASYFVSGSLIVIIVLGVSLFFGLGLFTKTMGITANTLFSRTIIWRDIFMMLNNSGPLSWFFGFSFKIFGKCLNITYINDPDFDDDPQTSQAHNGLLEVLGSGGIVLLLIDFVILCLIIYLCFFKNKKEKEKK